MAAVEYVERSDDVKKSSEPQGEGAMMTVSNNNDSPIIEQRVSRQAKELMDC